MSFKTRFGASSSRRELDQLFHDLSQPLTRLRCLVEIRPWDQHWTNKYADTVPGCWREIACGVAELCALTEAAGISTSSSKKEFTRLRALLHALTSRDSDGCRHSSDLQLLESVDQFSAGLQRLRQHLEQACEVRKCRRSA